MSDHALHDAEEGREESIRRRELEVFDVFTARALSIVRKEDKDTIADACRLVEAALKAARGDGSMPCPTTAVDNGVKGLIEELHTGYGKLRAAQAAGEPPEEVAP